MLVFSYDITQQSHLYPQMGPGSTCNGSIALADTLSGTCVFFQFFVFGILEDKVSKLRIGNKVLYGKILYKV